MEYRELTDKLGNKLETQEAIAQPIDLRHIAGYGTTN